jgi:arsenate reductase-like glutaredoxin family protein
MHCTFKIIHQVTFYNRTGSVSRVNYYDQSITTLDLIKWAHQISNGMEFIASKRVRQ